MSKKTMFSPSDLVTGGLQQGSDHYLNQMFSVAMIGIVVFLGLAWMMGRAATDPLTKQSTLRLSAQVRIEHPVDLQK